MIKNFFVIRELTDDDKNDIIYNIINNKYESAKEKLNSITSPIHIGRYETGWKFLFDCNDEKFFSLTRESINSFLSDNVKIVDDDYNEISLESFWEMVDNSTSGIGNKEYYSNKFDESSNAFFLLEEKIPFNLEKYNPKYYEFYSDNLRFSTEVNFK